MSGYHRAISLNIRDARTDLSDVWAKTMELVTLNADAPAEDVRASFVGLQGIWDEVLASADTSVFPTIAVVMTASPSNPYVMDETNIDEFVAEDKQETVLARIETVEAILRARHSVVIAAPEDAWEQMTHTSKQVVWSRRREEFPNLHEVHLSALPEGMSGAINIVGTEAVSINFKQANRDADEVERCFLQAGRTYNAHVIARMKEFFDPLGRVNGSHLPAIAPFYPSALD